MISTKRAMKIIAELDKDERNKMVDKLTEEDAKLLLKQCLTVMIGNTNSGQTIHQI